MGKSYQHIKALQQPDQTACWSTSMAWWTKALPKVKDYREIDILGLYSHLTGSDGGLRFPDGFKQMLSDAKWGMKVEEVNVIVEMRQLEKTVFAKSPVMCGYWDFTVGGFHAVALYNYKPFKGVWAMDPNGGMHVNRDFSYYFQFGKQKTVIGYIE